MHVCHALLPLTQCCPSSTAALVVLSALRVRAQRKRKLEVLFTAAAPVDRATKQE